MKNLEYSIFAILFIVALVMFSCEPDGEFDHWLNRDNRPEVPVIFTGASTVGANPYYTVPFSGNGQFQITISIPTDSRSKIKEITKVIAGTTAITPGNLVSSTFSNYLGNVKEVNDYQIVINTSIAEFNTKVTGNTRITAGPTAPTLYLERAFMFLITLEDGTTIITQQCRIRITP